MPLSALFVFALLSGVTEALPVSRSGHGAIAALWLGAPVPPAVQAAVLGGILVALLLLVQSRLRASLGDAMRAVARPSLFASLPTARDGASIALAAAVSFGLSLALRPITAAWASAPQAVGAGLALSAVALASTALAPRGRAETAPMAVALLAGVAHALASAPGASRVGAALTVLVWLGVRPSRAVEMAFAMTVPALVEGFVRALAGLRDLELGVVVAAMLLAFIGARVGAGLLQMLVERRRLPALALWLLPLSLATLAYAHALPS
jgi:undecaprenyl-diphosphatase